MLSPRNEALTPADRDADAAQVFRGADAMSARCRLLDWSATPLGPVLSWPAALRTSAQIALAQPFASIILWGPELVQLYNDSYRELMGVKHPAGLGQPTRECWPEVWHINAPIYDRVARGESFTFHDALYPITRSGVLEDAWFTLSYGAIRDDDGRVAGVLVTVVETTQRVLAERALRASESRYRSLFDSLDEGFAVIEVIFDAGMQSVNHRFLEANAAFARHTGMTDVVGRTALDLVPTLEPHWFDAFGRVARSGTPMRFESESAALGRCFDIYAFRVGHPDARQLGLLFRDVSAAKAASRQREQLLHALEIEKARLADVFQQAPAFLAVYHGPEHVCALANDAYTQLIGHGRDIIGKPLLEALPEVRGQGFDVLLDRVLETGEPFVGREVPVSLVRTPAAPAEARFVDLVYLPLVEGDGTRAGVIAHGTDVTAHVEARRAVERLFAESEAARSTLAERAAEREQLISALESSDDFIALASPEGMGVYVNAAGRRLTGLADVDAVRRARISDFFHPDDLPFVESTVLPALHDAGRWRGEMRFRHFETDAPIPVLYDAFKVIDPATGTLIGYGTVTRDLTERDRLVRDAEVARAEADRANKAKGDFLAVMSHELRTPLNAIGGYAELLELGIRGPITDLQREDVLRIQHSQRHLSALVDEVLDYAKMATGTVAYDIRDVPVCDALVEARALVEPQVLVKSLQLDVQPCALDLLVRADAAKLRQVLVNLLSNAVKFTDRGGCVTLSASCTDTSMIISVRDNGIGIATEQWELAFEPFVQVHDILTRKSEGTGLGLAISRDLARRMGGDLTLQSTLGVGSAFTLSLPRAGA